MQCACKCYKANSSPLIIQNSCCIWFDRRISIQKNSILAGLPPPKKNNNMTPWDQSICYEQLTLHNAMRVAKQLYKPPPPPPSPLRPHQNWISKKKKKKKKKKKLWYFSEEPPERSRYMKRDTDISLQASDLLSIISEANMSWSCNSSTSLFVQSFSVQVFKIKSIS